MKFKYAASASFYTCPDVVDILHSCDCIFTSNVDARDELYAALGSHRVHFIPGFLLANPNVRKEIQSGAGKEIEWINYADLRAAFKNWIANKATDDELIPWFGFFGWQLSDDGFYFKRGTPGTFTFADVLHSVRTNP